MHKTQEQVLCRPPWMAGVRNTQEQVFCQTRRLWRLGHLLGHVLMGVGITHLVFPGLRLARVDRNRGWQRGLVRWWNRGLLHILNVQLQLEGQIASGAVLYVANHISWLDIPCLRTVLNATFVSKDDVRQWPLIGAMAQQAGTIFIQRGHSNAANEAADRMTWLLARRQPVIVFPEGTTSEGRTVQRFHARLFQAAVRTQGTVQAVAISYPHRDGIHPRAPFVGEDNLVSHLWRLLKEDQIEARLVFCAPLTAGTRPRRALAIHTRVQILASLGVPSQTIEIPHAHQDL